MTTVDEQYINLVSNCLQGEKVLTRNSWSYRSLIERYEFTSTPLIGLRKTAWRNCLREWEWFMTGSNRIDKLHPSVQHWWKPWANKVGAIPFNYSRQFRHWNGTFDQLETLVYGLRNHPYSRRLVMTTWCSDEMVHPDCPITNCHGTIIQAFIEQGKLSLYTYQRSADVIVGIPHNWFQYWSFLLWLCARTDRQPNRLVWEGGDCHVYESYKDLAKRIINSIEKVKPTPQLVYGSTNEKYLADDFRLDREYLPIINEKAEMIV